MQIQPLPPLSTRVDACAEKLRAAILDGTFSPGVRLPAERNLAERFGVTRPTLRGALARLAARGLVHAHQGRGTIVCDFQETGGPDLIGEILAGTKDQSGIMRDLLAVRRALASVVLERVAQVRPDPAPVREAVALFAVQVQQGASPEALAATDLAILRALLAGTGSPVLKLCLNPILQVLGSFSALRTAMYQQPQDNLLGWQLLVAWMEEPSLEQVPTLMAALADRDQTTLDSVSI
jgi:DNA-binding FadR family transcriptional regulator